jgi:hypothetical protein
MSPFITTVTNMDAYNPTHDGENQRLGLERRAAFVQGIEGARDCVPEPTESTEATSPAEQLRIANQTISHEKLDSPKNTKKHRFKFPRMDTAAVVLWGRLTSRRNSQHHVEVLPENLEWDTYRSPIATVRPIGSRDPSLDDRKQNGVWGAELLRVLIKSWTERLKIE